jgi:hypothetical protein
VAPPDVEKDQFPDEYRMKGLGAGTVGRKKQLAQLMKKYIMGQRSHTSDVIDRHVKRTIQNAEM